MLTHNVDGVACVGVLIRDLVYDPREVLPPDIPGQESVLGLLRNWDRVHAILDKSITSFRKGVVFDRVQLLAPLLYPGALYCAGANYWDHLKEMTEVAIRTTGRPPSLVKHAEPWLFLKTTAGSIVGHNSPVRLPHFSKQVDWEAELGVVIARPTRNVSMDDAMGAIAGFVIVNDLSARDHLMRPGTPFIFDWIGQKCFDDSAPMGPWLTPAAYVRNPMNMSIKLWVNGELKQNSNTSQMVHSIAEQVAYLSRHITLQPGDVVATGSPAGVGLPRNEFLKVGDEVKIEIDDCGVLINRMVDDGSKH